MTHRAIRNTPTFLAPLALAAIALFSVLVTTPDAANGPSSVLVPLADGFDYPVGKPNAQGYYKARGFWPNVHPGEDWNGRRGGNSDLGDPVYSIADGVVVISNDFYKGWGNCVVIRHAYRDSSGRITMVDSQYAHLNRRHVRAYQVVKRGQQVGTIGTAHGRYPAHLHFEIRKNLKIGMNRSQFPRTYQHYHSPTIFINSKRNLRTSSKRYPVPIHTFAPYGKKLTTTAPAPTRPKNSVVPIRSTPKPKPAPRKLDPKLAAIIEKNKRPATASEENLDNFWSRLRGRFKAPEDSEKSSSRPRRRRR